jgi:uncharacterized iron-regulated membrane protein
MLSSRAIKTWSWLHKWTSLVCTLFMVLLCLTGLPLIFHHEIGRLLGTEVEAADMPADAPRVSLDKVMEVAKARHPGLGGMFVSQEPDDDRVWFVTLSPEPLSQSGLKQVAVDARTGQALAEPRLDSGFMYIMFSLHVDLFAGLAGKLFLGFMGLLLLVAIVSAWCCTRLSCASCTSAKSGMSAPDAPHGWTCTTCSASSPSPGCLWSAPPA